MTKTSNRQCRLNRPIRRPLAGLLLGALFAAQGAWAQVSAPSRAQVKAVTTTLVSASAHKECFTLSARQHLRYWYRSDGPVDFTVQYVEGKDTLYPVRRPKSVIDSGTYVAKADNDYCVVWTNTLKRPVTLSLEYARVNPGQS